MPVMTWLASKPGLHAEDALEAGEQQPGADEQHEGERDLRRHEHAPRDARAAAGGARAPFFAEALAQVHLPQAQNRDEADEDGEREREAEREGDHGRVDRDLRALRRRLEAERRRALERRRSRAPRPSAPPASDEQHGFGQELAARCGRARRRARGASPAPSCARWSARASGW